MHQEEGKRLTASRKVEDDRLELGVKKALAEGHGETERGNKVPPDFRPPPSSLKKMHKS